MSGAWGSGRGGAQRGRKKVVRPLRVTPLPPACRILQVAFHTQAVYGVACCLVSGLGLMTREPSIRSVPTQPPRPASTKQQPRTRVPSEGHAATAPCPVPATGLERPLHSPRVSLSSASCSHQQPRVYAVGLSRPLQVTAGCPLVRVAPPTGLRPTRALHAGTGALGSVSMDTVTSERSLSPRQGRSGLREPLLPRRRPARGAQEDAG